MSISDKVGIKQKQHLSVDQKKELVELVAKRPNLIKNKFTATFTYQHAQNQWIEIADSLNSMAGANKDWKSWRKTWQDQRSRARTKISKSRIEMNRTGGGTNTEEAPTPLEDQIGSLISNTSISGQSVTQESQLDFITKEKDPQSASVSNSYGSFHDLTLDDNDRQFNEGNSDSEPEASKENETTTLVPRDSYKNNNAIPLDAPKEKKAMPLQGHSMENRNKSVNGAIKKMPTKVANAKLLSAKLIKVSEKNQEGTEQFNQEMLQIRREELQVRKEKNKLLEKASFALDSISESLDVIATKLP